MKDLVTEWAKELQSLAQAGLFYGKDTYDRERYQRIREISAEMLACRTDLPLERVRDLFCGDVGYQTPKIDTRAAVFKDGRRLLVCEKEKWSLPGGWCEYNLSPVENTVKEVKEEAGLDVIVKRLIAAQDRDKHNQPRYAYGITQLFYLCEAVGGSFQENSETNASQYFAPDQLPPLALEKCTEEQICMCFEAQTAQHWEARFD